MYCTCHKPSLTDASSYSHWLSMVCALKGRLLKNLLVFLRKIEDLTFFLSTLSEQRGKRRKQPFGAPTDLVCKDRVCRGLFRRNGMWNWGWSHGYFRISSDVFGAWLEWPLGTVLHIRIAYKICSQKKKAVANFAMAQPSLFFPYFDFTLMNVYMNTEIK